MSDETNLDDTFGNPTDENTGFKFKFFSLSEKEANIYRIAPPVKSLKSVGKWKIFDSIHFGYTIPNEKKPEKPRHPAFRCIQKKNRNGMIEQDCPECDFLAREKAQDEKLKASNKPVRDWNDPTRHNLDKKYYVLAKNLAGEWGVLKIQYKAMQAIEDVLAEYQEQSGGQHALDAKAGVWLTISKSGKGFETRFNASVTLEDMGGGNFRRKPAALTSVDAAAIEKCPDLATYNDNKVLSYDQISALVASNGDPEVVAMVFGQPFRAEKAETPAVDLNNSNGYKTEKEVVQKVAELIKISVEDDNDEEAQLTAQLAAAKTKKAAAQAAKVEVKVEAKPEAPKVAVSDLKKMGPEEFMKMFPDRNVKP